MFGLRRKKTLQNMASKMEQSGITYLTNQVSELHQQLEAIKDHLGVRVYKMPSRYQVMDANAKKVASGGLSDAMAIQPPAQQISAPKAAPARRRK